MQEHDFSPGERTKLGITFNSVKQHARVSKEERKKKRQIVEYVLEELKHHMRLDTLFDEIFLEIKYTGSFFDNLRIVDANEFDINVVLKLPVRRDRIVLDSSDVRSNFATLWIHNWDSNAIVNLDLAQKNQFLKLLDSSGRLVPEKVLSWMQSVLARALNNMRNFTTPSYQLSMSASGPAKTLKITLPYQTSSIDVDLVAVFRFEPGQWVECNRYFRAHIVNQVYGARRRMYLVPKPHPEFSDCMWRKHFPEVEEELINRKMAAKPVIRILKLLRDRCQWYRIASYYLKTLVMIEIDDVDDDDYWHDRRTPYLIFTMMQKLINYFREGVLPHLLYSDVNLFEGLHPDELFNHYGHLVNIYNKWKRDIDSIEAFFVPGMNKEVEAILKDAPVRPSSCMLL